MARERVLCGGADEPFSDAATRDALSRRKFAFLERRLKAMFPALDATPDFGWAGAFGASDNGTPIIGPLPRQRRMYAVLGCGGNGITFSMLAAQPIRSLITGTGDPCWGMRCMPIDVAAARRGAATLRPR